ncbi:MAG: hypothetical protein COA45_04640 [Zetaproteobacteria bacterium]|nr:MAG: hypothetical protein COA45_04640 [Zetaproteobacteria bacterium]
MLSDLHQYRFETAEYRAGDFNIFAAVRMNKSDSRILHIVIEGDGYAWVGRYTKSDNPTPKDAVGVKIANAIQGDVIYLARPCQYIASSVCETNKYWTEERFAPEVVRAYNNILDQIKANYGVSSFIITGFSGGARIAYDLSMMRGDILAVNTVAGVIDVAAWTSYHDISAVQAIDHQSSMNMAQVAYMHICGQDEAIVPCYLHEKFIKQQSKKSDAVHNLVKIPNYSHSNLWAPAIKYLQIENPQ